MPEEIGKDVPYYRFEVAVKLVRDGDWSDYPAKQPVQVRGMTMTIPRDQLMYDVWKQAFGTQVVIAALSAVMAELKQSKTPELYGNIAGPAPGVG